MTRVLLIADTERVQTIFLSLEEKGVLQLRTVSTLDNGESELLAGRYDFTFVQSRISGFSGVILLRHLDKVLAEGGRLVLLGGDPEDAAHARRHGRESIDLALDDLVLEQTVLALVTGGALPEPEKAERPEKSETPAKAAKGKPVQRPPAADETGGGGDGGRPGAVDHLPQTHEAEPTAPEPAPESAPETVQAPVRKWEPAPFDEAPVPAEEPPETGGAAGGESPSFEEAMQRAASGLAIDPAALEVEDRVHVKGRGAADGEPPAREPVPTGGFHPGEPLADAIRRAEQKKSRRRYPFLIPVLLLLLSVPLISFFVGRSERTAGESPGVAAPPAPGAVLHAPPPGSPAGTQPGPPAVAAPGGTPSVPPAENPAAAAAAGTHEAAPTAPPAAKAAPRRGLEQLPPMLEGTRLDAEYGKSRPGWERYIGLRAEYNLFREENLYRAVQVVARAGGGISDDLFRRMLKEFGGIENYRVESTGSKGDYLVEQCLTNGNTGLTIYRSKDSRKMKGFVIYYR